MRDRTILETIVDPSGVVFELAATSQDIQDEFGLPPTLWSARHPNGSNYGMQVGKTPGEALARLLNKFPELAAKPEMKDAA